MAGLSQDLTPASAQSAGRRAASQATTGYTRVRWVPAGISCCGPPGRRCFARVAPPDPRRRAPASSCTGPPAVPPLHRRAGRESGDAALSETLSPPPSLYLSLSLSLFLSLALLSILLARARSIIMIVWSVPRGGKHSVPGGCHEALAPIENPPRPLRRPRKV